MPLEHEPGEARAPPLQPAAHRLGSSLLCPPGSAHPLRKAHTPVGIQLTWLSMHHPLKQQGSTTCHRFTPGPGAESR